MDILVLMFVGLIAGLLVALVRGGVGHGIMRGAVKGIIGALLGGWLFTVLDIPMPSSGIGGTIVVGLIGAAVLLLVPQAIDRRRRA